MYLECDMETPFPELREVVAAQDYPKGVCVCARMRVCVVG